MWRIADGEDSSSEIVDIVFDILKNHGANCLTPTINAPLSFETGTICPTTQHHMPEHLGLQQHAGRISDLYVCYCPVCTIIKDCINTWSSFYCLLRIITLKYKELSRTADTDDPSKYQKLLPNDGELYPPRPEASVGFSVSLSLSLSGSH